MSLALVGLLMVHAGVALPDTGPGAAYQGRMSVRASSVFNGATKLAQLEDGSLILLAPSDALLPKDAQRLDGDGPWMTGRLIVDLNARPSELMSTAQRVALKLHADVVRPLRIGSWVLLDLHHSAHVGRALTLLGLDRDVRRAEPELVRRLDVRSPLDDRLFPKQWHLENTAQRSAQFPQMMHGADINARGAWSMSTGDPLVVIAVLDTGMDLTHPEFLQAGKIVAAFNPLDLSSDPSPPPMEWGAAHGIACAGLAAASQAGTGGVVGVCPDCGVMPIRIFNDLGFTLDTSVLDALVHARENGASVVSNSWGYAAEFPPLAVRDALQELAKNGRGGLGAVVVFAIGNSGEEVSRLELATDPRCIAVGGTGSDDVSVSYSTWGTGLDVMAPTGDTGGPGLVTTDRQGDDGFNPGDDAYEDPDYVTDTDYTAVMSGTSGACPQVAGLAGLLLSVRPDLRYEQVFALIRDTAERVGGDHDATGWSPRYGHGRIDAAAALTAAVANAVCMPGVEVCNDGRDNDCDGSPDGDDEDCGYVPPEPQVPLGMTCDPNALLSCMDGFCTSADGAEGICITTCISSPCPVSGRCVLVGLGPGDSQPIPICLVGCEGTLQCQRGSACQDSSLGPVCVPTELTVVAVDAGPPPDAGPLDASREDPLLDSGRAPRPDAAVIPGPTGPDGSVPDEPGLQDAGSPIQAATTGVPEKYWIQSETGCAHVAPTRGMPSAAVAWVLFLLASRSRARRQRAVTSTR